MAMVLLLAAALAASVSTTLSTSAPMGDAAHGAKVFASICGTCHSASNPPRDVVGPSLFAVVGRKAGTKPGFSYSRAMASAGFVWTPQQLEAYIARPQAIVPGNRMPFAGLPNPKDRADVVGYLAEQR
jgi:cytochrome c